jgi:hypothetical protein
MDTRPSDVIGPDPIETDNGSRPEDGDQEISQSATDDFSSEDE